MKDIRKRIVEEFGNKLRVRVCGICVRENSVLLINHHSLNEEGDFWGPPGGGMDFGKSAKENLKREFIEETGLEISVERFLFVHEYLSPPLHAIELIFLIKEIGGQLEVGTDPEMNENEQIIQNVAFVPFQKVKKMKKGSVHQLFENVSSLEELLELQGFYSFNDK